MKELLPPVNDLWCFLVQIILIATALLIFLFVARKVSKRKDLIRSKISEIKDHLSFNDKWEDIIEWGVGKETYIKISKTIINEDTWYEVTVQLDHIFTCKCPTIERAAEFADIYENTIFSFYRKYGWPSWHSPAKL